MKRRLIILALILLLAVPGIAASAPLPQPTYDVTLSASVGYAGYYRWGHWSPVRVMVGNQGDDLNGYVQVRTGDLGGLEENVYRMPLDLPQGSRKQVFLYISFETFQSEVRIEIVDQDGDIIADARDHMQSVNQGDILIAVITESTFGAVDLTNAIPGTGSAHQVNWRIEDIPPLVDALAGLDVMLFHDVDTGALDAEQTAAIRQWVLGGGHLIVAGGDAWQRTTAGLDDLLPVTLERTVRVESVAVLADYIRHTSFRDDTGMTATRSVPRSSAQVLVETEGVPLLVRDELGNGLVDFLAVDPNAEPLRSWSNTRYLWYVLMASAEQEPSWSDDLYNWSVARDATLTTFNTVLPTFYQLCGFLIMYIILIGPVNYLVLKRLNRREWAWVSIPALIVIFSVLAYQVGFNLRGSQPTVNRLSVVQVWGDGEEAKVTSFVGVQSPRRTTYDMAVERGVTLRPLPEEGIGLNVPVTITEGTRYTAEDIPIDAGTIASFIASSVMPAPHLDSEVYWQLDDTATPHLRGRVTNTTGQILEDAVILVKGEARSIGTLNVGESRDFDIVLGPQDPAPLTLGNSMRFTNNYFYGYGFGRRPGGCFSYSGIYLTIPDVMQSQQFVCGSTVGDEEQEIRRRYRLLGSVVTDQDVSGGRGDDVYLFAWTDELIIDVELLDRPHVDEATTLYIFELPTETETRMRIVEIPPALTTWTITDQRNPDTLRDIGPTTFQINTGSQASFQFKPLPAMSMVDVTELIVQFESSGPLAVALWDWDQQVWIPIALDPDSASTALRNNIERYIGAENAVNVRVTSLDETAYNRVDYIKIAYRGQLVE
ncbi:MAG: hypothetical protein JXA10_11875 [Anaerolineae bacterium]|nr:hypothetical protein [Anaerolineae bacterium]